MARPSHAVERTNGYGLEDIAMGRTRARHQARPGALDRKKERRRRRRRARRLRRRRDVESVEVAGVRGHGSCGRKVRYPTRQGAETFAASVRARFGATLPEQTAYRCALCGGWHLTSHPRPQEPDDGSQGADVGAYSTNQTARPHQGESKRRIEDEGRE